MRTRKRTGWHRYINLLTISTTLTVLFVILPLLWMIESSFKGPSSITTNAIFPHPSTVVNYKVAFQQNTFGRYIINSLVVAVASTAAVLALGTLAGYGLGRMPMKGKLPILMGLLMISVFPAIAVIAPLYLLMREIGWLNSYQALIVPYTAFNLPFAIWILRNYFLSIPKEMEESARVDGASPLRTVWQVIIPQARPGLFTAGVFTFTACWTEFLMALTFDSSNSFRTIPVGVALFGSQFVVPYGTIFAASVVAVVPIGILVLVFRRSVISGLTAGAIKG